MKLFVRMKPLVAVLLGLLAVQCQRLPSQGRAGTRPGAATQIQPGTTRAVLVRATLLLPTSVLAPGELLIGEDGRIACVGLDCGSHPAARGATRLTALGSVVSPGLLNAHDHLSYDHLRPLAVTERYTNRQQWRLGLAGHTKLLAPPDSSLPKLLWSELRQVLVSTTSLVGISRAPGLLRNLDRADARLGLVGPPVRANTFPLRDQRTPPPAPAAGCGYPVFTEGLATKDLYAAACFVPHVAEGSDPGSATEFRCLAGLLPGSQRLLPDGTALVHAISLSRSDAQWVQAHGMSVVWSPHSNLVLYGQTAPVQRYDSLGINLLLSTDWTPTGSATLAEELRYAAQYNQAQLHGYFSDRQLWQMVTSHAARGLGLAGQLGELAVGQWADIALYDDTGCATPYQAVIRARAASTQLVLRAGQPLYGNARPLRRLPASRGQSERLPLGGGAPPKRVCLPPEASLRMKALQAANRTSLPLVPTER
jgi:hypothetical protein